MTLIFSRIKLRMELEKLETAQYEKELKKLDQNQREILLNDYGLHIFLVGVSQYNSDFFSTVDSSSLSAYHLYTTFLKQKNILNISTIRILIAPSIRELTSNTFLNKFYNSYKNDNIEANSKNFRKEIYRFYKQKLSPKDKTLFYFVGHGLRRDIENLMVFPNCDEYNFKSECVSTDNLTDVGVSESEAKQHLFFFDSCKNFPKKEKQSQYNKFLKQISNLKTNIDEIFSRDSFQFWQEDFENKKKIIFSPVLPGYKMEAIALEITPFAYAISQAFLGYALEQGIFSSNWYISLNSLSRSLANHLKYKINELKIQYKLSNEWFQNEQIFENRQSAVNGEDILFEWNSKIPDLNYFILIKPKINVLSELIINKRNYTLNLLKKNYWTNFVAAGDIVIRSELNKKTNNIINNSVKSKSIYLWKNFKPSEISPFSIQISFDHKKTEENCTCNFYQKEINKKSIQL